jgi:two-component system, cell cycle response regulator DivK
MAERDRKDLKVLLVEDFEDTRLFMRLALEDQGFIVFEAENGQAAVETASREKPDVILMDLTLPLMDGFEATKLIRRNDALKNVPIIAVTAHQEDDFRSDAKASGFDAYVTKPIDVNWLKELIAGLLI